MSDHETKPGEWKDAPSGPGLYWVDSGQGQPTIILLVELIPGMTRAMELGTTDALNPREMDARWWGPIDPPPTDRPGARPGLGLVR